MGVDSLSLVVPLYEETHRLGDSFDQLVGFVARQPAGSELIFVDDGSTDLTHEAVEKLAAGADIPVSVLVRPHRGKGAAVRAGLEVARGDVAAFCDVDLSTSLADLASLADAARARPILAIGSRDLPGSNLARPEGRVREFLGRSYNRAVQFALLPGIVDTQCGAKAARTDVWRRLLAHSAEDGFAWDVEVIALARLLGITVEELPVTWRHDRQSRVRVARDGARMVGSIARIHRRLRQVAAEREPTVMRPEVFDGDLADDLADADATHWWFRSKASFVSTALRRFPPGPGLALPPKRGWLVDVGAGSAGVTAMLGWGMPRTLAVEGSPELIRRAHARYSVRVAQGDVAALPLADGSASVLCLLDVLEHLVDPARALAEAHRVLAPGGRLIVTVPAHPRLWSAMDEAIGHKRRYTRRLARAEQEAAGFEVLWASHIFSWLFVPVWFKRRARPGAGPEFGLDVSSTFVDRMALLLTRLERPIVGRIELPVGTSILCVATRR